MEGCFDDEEPIGGGGLSRDDDQDFEASSRKSFGDFNSRDMDDNQRELLYDDTDEMAAEVRRRAAKVRSWTMCFGGGEQSFRLHRKVADEAAARTTNNQNSKEAAGAAAAGAVRMGERPRRRRLRRRRRRATRFSSERCTRSVGRRVVLSLVGAVGWFGSSR